jgi:hypothetical protein
MAFRAGHSGVRARQRVPRRGVIEAGRRLPACGGMAVRAISAQLSAVLILVAACARAAESQVSVVEVLYLNPRPSGGQDVLSSMALFTAQSDMFAGQREPCLAVVQRLSGRLPSDHLKVRAIMIGVASNAILARAVWPHPDRMHTAILREPIPNFCVAIQAFEFDRARGQVVAFSAVEHSRERLMGFR